MKGVRGGEGGEGEEEKEGRERRMGRTVEYLLYTCKNTIFLSKHVQKGTLDLFQESLEGNSEIQIGRTDLRYVAKLGTFWKPFSTNYGTF